jgi:hypothetical protein
VTFSGYNRGYIIDILQLARTFTGISKWKNGIASFDPYRLIQTSTVGSQFHVKLSIDFEQNKIRAEIEPKPGTESSFNPFPVGSDGAIAAPFVAITNLINYKIDPDYDGTVTYAIFIRTNGNTEVDDTMAPGGTLRYIRRDFSNVGVFFNQPIEFPIIPELQGAFPSDDFNDGIISPCFNLDCNGGLDFEEGNGVFKLYGVPTEDGISAFHTSTVTRQDINIGMDFCAPTGFQNNTTTLFRLQFDPFNYIQIGVDNSGYNLARVIDNKIDSAGNMLPLFGNERSKFHHLRIAYNDATGHTKAFVDGTQLEGIPDKIIPSSYKTFQFVVYSFTADGLYIERKWDNLIVSVK